MRPEVAGEPDPWVNYLLQELEWTERELRRRSVGLQELVAAREMWDWHARFENEASLQAAAERLNALYKTNSLAAEFEPLLDMHDHQEAEARADAKVDELARGDAIAIREFVQRAVQFCATAGDVGRLNSIAWKLGRRASKYDGVASFVRDSLGDSTEAVPRALVLTCAAGWFSAALDAPGPRPRHALVEDLLQACAADTLRLDLVARLYGGARASEDLAAMTTEEHLLLRGLQPLFRQNGRLLEFIGCLGTTVNYDWSAVRQNLEECLREVLADQLVAAVRTLVNAAYWAVRDTPKIVLPSEFSCWLLEQVLLLPDVDDLGGDCEWHLKEILKRVVRPPITWLAQVLAKRSEDEKTLAPGTQRTIGHNSRISSYVARATSERMNDPDLTRALGSLIDLVSNDGTIGYRLPEVLSDVDPEGLFVPHEVARRVRSEPVPETVRRLARIARAYALGGPSWRLIARPVLERAATSSERARRSLFAALSDRGIRSWSSRVGEVSEVQVGAVDDARRALESEADVHFTPFWEWMLARAEAELRDEEELAKEERGE